MSFEYSKDLINDYEKLLEIDKGYDVIIYAGENDNMKEIYAHSFILRIRSQYFRAAFSNEWAIKKDGKFIFKKPNVSPQIFKIVLRFIYCGKVDLKNLKNPELLNLLVAVDELNIQTLIPCIQDYLINHQHEILQQNPVEILEIVHSVHQCDTFSRLWDYFLETICDKPDILFNPDNLIKLKEPLLKFLLNRDDLMLDEIVIWDNLIKWSFTQHPTIQQDVNKWNNEEIAIMKSTFQDFIPLIRFYQISSEDFHSKVYPFRVLLPEDLIDNILAFHATPNKILDNNIQPSRNPKYNTYIVKSQHFAIFSSWIEKKSNSYYNLKCIPYHFNLIYRASRDGFTAEAFHENCDDIGATITIVKIKGSEQIFGGFNPFDWDLCGDYKTTKNSFIFSFMDRKNMKTAKVGYSNGRCSVGCYQDYGPIFGYYLYYKNTHWMVNNDFSRNYPGIKIPISVLEITNIDDYEVFQIVKKS
ncbi:BTB/POZ domain-containing protein [Rhizophagus irregularis DAOM 181602=DAOM 197198]|uniref:Btb/poz domain-containing protein 19-like n=3 Tax=Rhizophagus irregularis TaxID=588596 RepID=A0A015LVL7_RHIIW|nr:hypothetical protein GLOIN_2v1845142 [Rhizophagus irregularis DAOM 181602=DAOM 197198]EXX76731.1 hypothetical protein RirG_030380 [Rhizophagus irregularis DAOM 197198w]POG64735.1 hypothetical protein GLOIN_2v1845142 [Rhizophagus irregularis DAOM 181602=DAOM 197198]GBC17501.1 BTB/POZ domain-containing protein [Rhizophagus irregularis DAOM 181602=DAOM 197198]|eukprot:XP_025171601.1 hypothetical protein GLOIN_2v1845142 [Rhizophagus irregularis DAOM 181602=DAOM 197198]